MTTGEILKSIIQDNDISIEQLSNYIGVNPRQITRWENDESEMGIYKLKAICQYIVT